MSESEQILQQLHILDPVGIYRSMDESLAREKLNPKQYKEWQQAMIFVNRLTGIKNHSNKENEKMTNLTPDQIDILSEIEETIEKLATIASRVERGKSIGSLLSIKSNRLNYLFGRYQMYLDMHSRTKPRKNAEEITEAVNLEMERREIEAERKQIETERRELEIKKRELEVEIESILPTVATDQLIENHDIWEKEQRAKRSKKANKDEPSDDRISVNSLANMSAADALHLNPQQHKRWLAIQRERYSSQHNDH